MAVDAYADLLPRNRTIAVYCRSGSVSSYVARELAKRGFKVYNLEGWMNSWIASGRELVYKERT